MTIPALSSTTSSTQSSNPGGLSIGQLEKQLQDLEKQLKDEGLNKSDDAKTKAEKLKALELEIQLVQEEIQQEQTKAAKKAAQQTEAGKLKHSNQPDASTPTPDSELLNQVA